MPRLRYLKKRYFLNCVEEMICNPEFYGYRMMRVEVTDTESKSPYPIYEAVIRVPEEMFEAIYKVFDFKYVDKLPYMRWEQKP